MRLLTRVFSCRYTRGTLCLPSPSASAAAAAAVVRLISSKCNMVLRRWANTLHAWAWTHAGISLLSCKQHVWSGKGRLGRRYTTQSPTKGGLYSMAVIECTNARVIASFARFYKLITARNKSYSISIEQHRLPQKMVQ